jgi:hypothetical protein
LIPKKPDQLIKPVADELGVSEKLVDAVKSFFWKEVRKSITDMRYHSIFIDNLGTFKVKSWKLQELLQKYRDYLNASEGVTFHRMAVRLDIEARILKVEKLIVLLEKEKLKKESVKEKRYGKDIQGSME